MSELADSAGKFADKFAELLDVFDFSFFVSGTIALGAIAVTGGIGLAEVREVDSITFILTIVVIYALGMMCFGLGRAIRVRIFSYGFREFRKAREALSLALKDLPEFADIVKEDGTIDETKEKFTYTRMWAQLRTVPELSGSFALLRRYWIHSATFDGMAIAILIWDVPLLIMEVSWWWKAVGVLVSALLALFCLAQAKGYRDIQESELVASILQWHGIEKNRSPPD